MSKKILGMVTAGLLFGMGSAANAAIMMVTSAADGWQTTTFNATGYSGSGWKLTLGVTDPSFDSISTFTLDLDSLSTGLLYQSVEGGGVTGGKATVSTENTGDGLVISLIESGGLQFFRWKGFLADTEDYFTWKVTNSVGGEGGQGVTIGDRLEPELESNPVPEPGTVALMAIGILGAGFAARRKVVV